MSKLIPLALLTLSTAAGAQTVPAGTASAPSVPVTSTSAASAPSQADVVVTALPLRSTAKALADCLARHCPPDEDIRATLAHAENQFVAGDYHAARRTLQASKGRNRGAAAAYPVPVGDLMRADARVALHLGEGDEFRIGEIDSLSALKAGLPANDPRVLAQRVEVADALIKFGRVMAALDEYRQIAVDAGRAGAITVRGYALLRVAVLLTRLAESDAGTYAADARRATAILAATTEPGLAPFRAAAELLAARRDAKAGDQAAIDRLVARFATPGRHPVLIYAPPFDDNIGVRASQSGTGTNRIAGNFENQWVDVSFWIGTDGKVSDVALLRTSGHYDTDWAKRLQTNIAERRYSPADGAGALRVERYTRTADWVASTGSHLRQREPLPRTEVVDLTADASASPPPASTPGG